MTRRVAPAALLVALPLFLIPASADAGDWAYWRGPEMSGVSRESGLPETWSLGPDGGAEGGENVLWTSDVGGRAAPAVLNGRVYLNTRTAADVRDPEEVVNARQMTICWDAVTGEELWRDEFNVAQTDIPSNRVGFASPVGDAETGNVYVHTVDGLMICYSADGDRLWEHAMYPEFGHISGYGGRTATPIVDEERVVVSFLAGGAGSTKPGPPAQYFYAFDKRTGDVLWATAPGGRPYDTLYTNPVIAVIGGVRQLICGNADGGIYGIQARTGEPIWGFRMAKRGLNASAVVADGLVYITHGEDNIDTTVGGLGRVQCIDPMLGGDTLATGDLTDNPAASVWRVNGVKAGYSSPVAHEGILYVVADTGKLYAFDAKTGDELWTQILGTVGKGSPVWADGKLYVMENAGRVWTLGVSREGVEVLNEVVLQARVGQGLDELFASPAISDGKIYLVTRDRTICIGEDDPQDVADLIPPPGEEADVGTEPAVLRLSPHFAALRPGDEREMTLRAYDANGRFLKTIDDYELTAADGFDGLQLDATKVSVADDLGVQVPQATTVTAEVGGLTADAYLRVYPPLPWSWDFEDLKGKAVSEAWVNAPGKLTPVQRDGNTVVEYGPGPGAPAFEIFVGPPDMGDYVVQADVMVTGKRRLASPGVINERYSFILKANTLKLGIQTWQAHLRLGEDATMKFKSDPDVWYRLKLAVENRDGVAHVRGKAWPRDGEEPAEWTLEVTDPHPNGQGAPGIYAYRLADGYFDNVTVTPAESGE